MMKKLIFVLIAFSWTPVFAQATLTTFILIRHAEKGNDGTNDPDLSEAGKKRAIALVKLLKETKIDAIYSTAFKRTRNTVVQLAKEKSLTVKEYDGAKMEDVDAILKEFKGGTIVLSGHSNTTPAIANYLIGRDQYKTFDDSAYGNVLVINIIEKGVLPKVVWITY